MTIVENVSLKSYNTFGIDAYAKCFSSFDTTESLIELLGFAHNKKNTNEQQLLVIGGGSNILFTRNFDGLVLQNQLKGISLVSEDKDYYYVKANAGENWHSFVQYCISQNYAGLENLSLIPGCVGASPMQNIGAYGVEIKDVFHSLEALHIYEKKVFTFNSADCTFGYRESIFKNKFKGQFVILNVTFRLRKDPIFHTSYGAIQKELENMGVTDLSIKAISQAVINIRQSKLPDPAVVGNAGSFFKNPQIHSVRFQQLQTVYPDIIGYPVDNNSVKLAAGWLIEQCGWKGYREGNAGCHEAQALVLVNYGDATGREIWDLSEKIINSVYGKFGVTLEREVNVV